MDMIELIATEGFVYCLKTDPTIYGKKIVLGVEESPDNWILMEEPKIEDNNLEF